MLLIAQYVWFVLERKRRKKSGDGDSNKTRIVPSDSLLPENRAATSSCTILLINLVKLHDYDNPPLLLCRYRKLIYDK